jgi:hypothetical protein
MGSSLEGAASAGQYRGNSAAEMQLNGRPTVLVLTKRALYGCLRSLVLGALAQRPFNL